MLRARILSVSLLLVSCSSFALSSQNSVRVIIKYKKPQQSISFIKSQIQQSTSLPIKALNPMANGAYLLILDSSQNTLSSEQNYSSVLQMLHKNSQILYAVQDRVSYFKPVPDPEVFDVGNLLSHESQWDEFAPPAGVMLESKPGLKDGAWAYTTGLSKEEVVIAVLDTGIALNNSLVKNLIKENNRIWGWNFSGNNDNLADETKSYHGTHVAGTIAGYGEVMSGVGEDLKILPLKIPAANGMFYESSVINALYWAVGEKVPGVPKNNHPAKVLNMSFGIDKGPREEINYCDQALQEAVFFARKKGAVLAIAAGNNNEWENFGAPAVCQGTIKVASTGPEGLRSYFSNYGPSVTLAAPGGDKRYGIWGGILSTVNPGSGYMGSGFDFYQGTSMATPHVAGVAGLVYAVSNKVLTAEQVEQLIYTTTHDFGKSIDSNKSCVGKKPCGHGILDAENAVKAAAAGYDLIFSSPKIEQVFNKGCKKESSILKAVEIIPQGISWYKKSNNECNIDKMHKPHLTQTKEGAIVANYGSMSYILDQGMYKSCHIIGDDGVGCYL